MESKIDVAFDYVVQSWEESTISVSCINFLILFLFYSLNCIITKKEEVQEVQECYLWYIWWDYNKLSTVLDLWSGE